MNTNEWQRKMDGDMVIAGLGERTREAYARAVRQLSSHYGDACPFQIGQEQVKAYLLWLRVEKEAAPGTLRIAIGGLRFFYRHTCPQDWAVLLKFRVPKETRLPTVLTREEVNRIMAAVRLQRFQAYFWTVYSCGLTRPALKFLARLLQHVLPRGFHRVRHYGFLSRRSKTDLDDLRSLILESLADVEPDFELEQWTVPQLSTLADSGPSFPTCGGPLTFEAFQRIRPPPLTDRRHRPRSNRSF